MSIADHFDHTPDVGFVRSYDSTSARRQFQVSVVLIVVLAAAAMTLGMVIRFDDPPPVAPTATPASVTRPAPVPALERTRGATGGQDFARTSWVLPALRG